MIYRPLLTIDPAKYRGGFNSARYNLQRNQFLENVKRAFVILDEQETAIDINFKTCLTAEEYDPVVKQLDGTATTLQSYPSLSRRLDAMAEKINFIQRSM